MIITLCLYLTLPVNADNSCPVPVPTNPGNASTPEDWHDTCGNSKIVWNDPVSDDTIARNSSCTVAITDALGKGGPYTWSVSGNGFSLKNDPPSNGLTNTLYANGTACGTATITVIGCNGTTKITGYVRCTTGTWVTTQTNGPDCPWGGAIEPDSYSVISINHVIGYKTINKWKVTVNYTWCASRDPVGPSCASWNQLYGAYPLGLEPVLAHFVANSGPCCGSSCNECLTFKYYDANQDWPGVTAKNNGAYETAALGIAGHVLIIGTYPAYCNAAYPYRIVSSRLTFWKTAITVQEWRCS